MFLSVGVPFLCTGALLRDFVLDRGAEPGGPTVPGNVLSTVSFCAELGGVPEGQRLSRSPAFRRSGHGLQLDLAANAPTVQKKAPRHLAVVTAAWEVLVLDPQRTWYVRVLAWVKLLRVWGCLRPSDMASISVSSLELRDGALSGRIEASKTTGTGESERVAYFSVSTSAGLLEPDWLVRGLRRCCESDQDRSLLLPPPTKDEDGASDAESTFLRGAVASRRLLVATPALRAVSSSVEAERNEPLLPVETHLSWAEHSDRATLPSRAAACGVAKDERDYSERRRPTESDGYVRVARRIVLHVQSRDRVALVWKAAGAEDIFDEELTAVDLVDFSVTCEVPREKASDLAAALMERGRLLRKWSSGALAAARAPTTSATERGRIGAGRGYDRAREEGSCRPKAGIPRRGQGGLAHAAPDGKCRRRRGRHCQRFRGPHGLPP